MVRIVVNHHHHHQRNNYNNNCHSRIVRIIFGNSCINAIILLAAIVVVVIAVSRRGISSSSSFLTTTVAILQQERLRGGGGGGGDGGDGGDVTKNLPGSTSIHNNPAQYRTSCPYGKLSDLTHAERYPQQYENHRHIVQPPTDGNVTLVCCHTTVGSMNLLIHSNWAPIGAQRLLDMIRTNYFTVKTPVPLMRCIKNFICQFGLNGQPTVMKPFLTGTMQDDPNWLPEGPEYRVDATTGVKRFNRGYIAYAGAGPHSRDIQFIMALADNGPLGGGSPWEVPIGELVGNHSFHTLSQIYTGYGEDGPSQGLLHRTDAVLTVQEKYPKLDYIQSCFIADHYIDSK